MTKEREALKLALDYIVSTNKSSEFWLVPGSNLNKVVTAIREALAQPEQEPLEYWNAVEGWVKIEEVREHFDSVGCGTIYKTAGEGREPLYTTPPKRPWVGLTDEQKYKLIKDHLGLEQRRDDTVIDRRTGRFTDAARYFALIDAAFEIAHGIKEKNT